MPAAKTEAKNPPAFYFPIAGCEPARPMSQAAAEKETKQMVAMIRENWTNPGLQAVLTLIERKAAISKSRACKPGADTHLAGQGFALEQLVAEVQAMCWSA